MTGCSAAKMHSDTLHSRASFDLRCPPAQLAVTEIDNKTAGVDGCGQRATYIYNAPAGTWVLNSPPSDPSQPGGGPPPPPAAAPAAPH
jgi:hypothetical protein